MRPMTEGFRSDRFEATRSGRRPRFIPIGSRPSRFLLASAPLLLASLMFAAVATARQDDATTDAAADRERFATRIIPFLSTHCLECHSGSTLEGGLDLSRRDRAEAGGDSGPAIVPGDVDGSQAWQRIVDGSMPHDRPAPLDAEAAEFERWIRDGAVWDRDAIDAREITTDRRAGLDWWSLIPPVDTPPIDPTGDPTRRNEIDAYLADRLLPLQLTPNDEASRRTLIRRLAFDLTGLPPEPDEVDRFENDPAPDAYERLVDRLLASPDFGERWARHWMDVIRFGESQGFERNRIRDSAWRYRDWIVSAFNRDLPYDEFVKLQLAGDVLRPGTYDGVVATGFHVCGTWDQVAHVEGSGAMRLAARQDHLEDLIGTYGQAFLGLTLQCARCHDHKFDPIEQRDYFRTAAVLDGVHQREPEASGLKLTSADAVGAAAASDEPYDGPLHVPHFAEPGEVRLLRRGQANQPLDPVEPATIDAVRIGELASIPLAGSDAERRRALAEWTVDPRHPLTPRVIANRLWQHHFGTGIVDTPSDFGFSGGRPSHPELLDHLALRLIESDWSLKQLHRHIVTSAAYRRSSERHPQGDEIDAAVRMRFRANLRQLEGEAVRDAMLACAGVLVRRLGGPSYEDVVVERKQNHEFTVPTDEFSAATCRRTIYRLWARSGAEPLLQSLDCPDPSVAVARRPGTITPIQALGLQNGPLARHCAAEFAKRVVASAGPDRAAQLRLAWRIAYGRSPRDEELREGLELVDQVGLEPLLLALLDSNEFLFVD